MSMPVARGQNGPTEAGPAPARRQILVVEDESELAAEIRHGLERAGFLVRVVHNREDGLAEARSREASVLVMDRMLGDEDGLSIVETLRREGIMTPVLVISALSSVDERIEGLKAGGDDYLVKPFDVRELAARVEVLLRRGQDSRATRLKVGVLDMDLLEQTVHCDGRPIDLVPREFKLLEYFMRHADQVVTRTMLLTDVWNFRFMAPTNVVDVHLGSLRRKLDPTGKRNYIVNIRSVGFKLDAGQ